MMFAAGAAPSAPSVGDTDAALTGAVYGTSRIARVVGVSAAQRTDPTRSNWSVQGECDPRGSVRCCDSVLEERVLGTAAGPEGSWLRRAGDVDHRCRGCARDANGPREQQPDVNLITHRVPSVRLGREHPHNRHLGGVHGNVRSFCEAPAISEWQGQVGVRSGIGGPAPDPAGSGEHNGAGCLQVNRVITDARNESKGQRRRSAPRLIRGGGGPRARHGKLSHRAEGRVEVLIHEGHEAKAGDALKHQRLPPNAQLHAGVEGVPDLMGVGVGYLELRCAIVGLRIKLFSDAGELHRGMRDHRNCIVRCDRDCAREERPGTLERDQDSRVILIIPLRNAEPVSRGIRAHRHAGVGSDARRRHLDRERLSGQVPAQVDVRVQARVRRDAAVRSDQSGQEKVELLSHRDLVLKLERHGDRILICGSVDELERCIDEACESRVA
eukprot:scaffold1799_cov225-Pinguiococcus_pyrenoidosus.AAC.4